MRIISNIEDTSATSGKYNKLSASVFREQTMTSPSNNNINNNEELQEEFQTTHEPFIFVKIHYYKVTLQNR